MHLELSDKEAAALTANIIGNDRYASSESIRTPKAILAKLTVEPVREPFQRPKDPVPATAKEHRSAAVKHEFH
jgi:hypothetical protein